MQAHQPRKRFGQNFLIAKQVIADLIALISPQPQEHIVEIGPGLGAITSALIQSQAQIDAIEIDRDLAAMLQQKFKTCANFKLHCQDVLKFSLRSLFQHEPTHKLRIVGNLPYNISTPLLFKLFADIEIVQDMYFMLQREVAERLIASPSTKEYGRLSVMAQYYCAMEIILDVPPTAFNPPPKVNSSIVRFVPHTAATQVSVDNHELLQSVVTEAFNHRRKNIANSLKCFLTAQELQDLQIDCNLRAENLNLLDYTQIANYLSNKD
jgi:16S rRNA (adenine1518-N6/adenine1519-N6)-dimethyltransferase